MTTRTTNNKNNKNDDSFGRVWRKTTMVVRWKLIIHQRNTREAPYSSAPYCCHGNICVSTRTHVVYGACVFSVSPSLQWKCFGSFLLLLNSELFSQQSCLVHLKLDRSSFPWWSHCDLSAVSDFCIVNLLRFLVLDILNHTLQAAPKIWSVWHLNGSVSCCSNQF